MPLKLMNASALGVDDERLAEDRRRRADDVRHLAQRLDLGAVVRDAASASRRRRARSTEDAIAQLALQAGHQRQRDDERHHADGDAERRDERDDRDERLLRLASR